jgi:hypothetical protein
MNMRTISRVYVAAFALVTLAGCSTPKADFRAHSGPSFTWTHERDSEVRALLQARYDATVKAYDTQLSNVQAGLSYIEFLLQLADQVTNAECELAQTPEQVILALEKRVEVAKRFETDHENRMRFGPLTPSRVKDLMESWRLSAELDLLRAKRFFANHAQYKAQAKLNPALTARP